MLDRALLRGPLEATVAAAVRGGVDWVQVRDRALEGAALLELADAVARVARGAAAARGHTARIVVNRRADVALAAGADGVHLGFDGMPAEVARPLLGSEAPIGVSVHAPGEVPAAGGAASYAHLAPIFPPFSKAATRPPLGLSALAEAARRGTPVFAQGGIDAARAGEAVAAGAAGVAVTGAVLDAPDPEAAARSLRAALDAGPAAPHPWSGSRQRGGA